MAKDVISVDGEDVVVREDTAKSYRGVIWALTSIGIFIVILAILFLAGFLKSASDGKMSTPGQLENSSRQ
jgi:hypothetical protein